MKKIINTVKAPKPIGPYNQAIMSNNTLYVSGQIPLNPATSELVKGDVQEQTRMVMENLKAILKEAGMDFGDVVKCSIFISDMKDFPKINEVYGKYFTEEPPARETVQVAGLPLGVDVEISCIAVI
ncbi:MAG: RidA family protein [Bacteroidetes bacterium]|nr:MAG: RidA family protein [Bacteroidota bacterium]